MSNIYFEYIEPVFDSICKSARGRLGITNYSDTKQSRFPIMFMISEDSGKSFRWYMTKLQKEYIIEQLPCKANFRYYDYVNHWLQYKFVISGLIQYVNRTGRMTEFIQNFKTEKFIKEGYTIDKQDPENERLASEAETNNLLIHNRNEEFDKFEENWAFSDTPFFYFKIFGQDAFIIYGLIPCHFLATKKDLNQRIDYMLKVNELIEFSESYLAASNELRSNISKSIEDIRKHSLRAAIAAIMGRNLSHNIGSHAIYYLTQELRKGQEISTKTFLDYLRERMGFVGLISTTEAKWASTSNLRTGEERWEQNSVSVLGKFINNKLLTENITKSEIGNKIYHIEIDGSCIRRVDFPHASYGHQAFYVILENIIRNSIKHNSSEAKQRKCITTKQSHSDNYKPTFDDNEIIAFKIKCIDEESDKDFIKVTIEDNFGNCDSTIVQDLQGKFLTPITNKDGSLNSSNLGMKELGIAASFLQMNAITETSEDSPIRLYCSSSETCGTCGGNESNPVCMNGQKGNLVYEFKLLRPKKCLVVTEDSELINKNSFFDKDGLNIISLTELEKYISRSGNLRQDFIVIDEHKNMDAVNNFVEKYWPALPFRIGFMNFSFRDSFVIESADLNKLKYNHNAKETVDDFLRLCWGKWFAKISNGNHYIIGLTENHIESSLFTIGASAGTYNSNDIVFTHNNIKNIQTKVYYYDVFSGTPEEFRGEIAYSLLESCYSKIAIADERVYGVKDKTTAFKDYEATIETRWAQRRIKFIDYKTIITDLDFSSVVEFKPDIFIIHMGILDKCKERLINEGESTAEAEKTVLEAWSNFLTNTPTMKRVVIDSDRGEPEDIGKYGGLWLHFSELSRLIVNQAVDTFSKLELVRIISKLRAKVEA